MSVQSQIDRLAAAKAAIKTAIVGKGVTVPDATALDGFAALIDAIEAGGGGVSFETGTVTFVEETSAYTFVENEPDLFICYIEPPLKDTQTAQQPDDLYVGGTSSSPYFWSIVQYKKEWYYYNYKQSRITRYIGYNKGSRRLYAASCVSAATVGVVSSGVADSALGAQTYRWFALYGVTIQ